jgi:CBS-domain-containing membrane protein
VLLFGFPDAPLSQPLNAVGGHVISSFVGLLALEIFGAEWWAVGIAVGGAIAAMMLTRTVYPPAGSNPVIVFLVVPGWDFLFFPTLIGAAIVVANRRDLQQPHPAGALPEVLDRRRALVDAGTAFYAHSRALGELLGTSVADRLGDLSLVDARFQKSLAQ